MSETKTGLASCSLRRVRFARERLTSETKHELMNVSSRSELFASSHETKNMANKKKQQELTKQIMIHNTAKHKTQQHEYAYI